MLIVAATAWPSRRAGKKVQVRTVLSTFSRNGGDPLTTLVAATLPQLSISASITTSPPKRACEGKDAATRESGSGSEGSFGCPAVWSEGAKGRGTVCHGTAICCKSAIA